jgi:hypothetical protein
MNLHPDSPLRYGIAERHNRNCAFGGSLLHHLSLLQPAGDRLRCRPDHHPFYSVGTGSSEIRSSIAPNRRRSRCPSAKSSQ